MSIPEQADLNSPSDTLAPLPEYTSILLAADASDHSDQGVRMAALLGKSWNSRITGAHVYAAKLHDVRFRQMEGGLPEQYKEETELERQRDIHDELITKGLSVITDSYLDGAEETCTSAGLEYVRRSLEGKNYREMVRETNSGKYDLLVMGALGLGAVEGSRIGTVCERVVRRTDIDTLIIKDTKQDITAGPIVVAVDGSSRSYAGLLSAFAIHKAHQTPIHVVSAYDPYYHYVAFNRIAEVLSEEAGKIFRFKEQEELHESIIDQGLAKIYDGHLHVARSIAEDYGIEISTELLDGKAHDAIEKYVRKHSASLLLIGKLGIHADDELDIGGNAENLLRNVPCAVLISQSHFTPQIDIIAEATTTWTHQAEARMTKIPSFAQGMAKMAILRFAQERGHTVITESIVREATDALCPVKPGAMSAATDGQTAQTVNHNEPYDPDWSDEAEQIVATIRDQSMRNNMRRRAEKKARQQKSLRVQAEHILAFMSVEKPAESEATTKPTSAEQQPPSSASNWSAEALLMLQRVPEGGIRDMARSAAETIAAESDVSTIDEIFFSAILDTFKNGSEAVEETLSWSDEARQGIAKAPPMVRGMLAREIENYARELGRDNVDETIVKQVKVRWDESGYFHQSATDPRSANLNPASDKPRDSSDQGTTANAGKPLPWQQDALQRLNRVPEGFMRESCRKRIEAAAADQNQTEVTLTLVEQQLDSANTVMQKVVANGNGKCPFGHDV
ncbi:MAG: universal stress protein [Motiliproteus sp.]